MDSKSQFRSPSWWRLTSVCLALCGGVFVQTALAAGWSSPGTAKWGAKVLSLVTVAASGSSVAATYVFLEPTGAVNVNTCPSYTDTANVLGPGVSSVMFMMVHSSLTVISETQKAYLAELHAAFVHGKELLVYSNGCTSASSPGYNSIDGIWVKW